MAISLDSREDARRMENEPSSRAVVARAPSWWRSLRVRWTATLLLCGAVPLALLAVRTVAIQRDALEDAERQLQVAVIDHVASLVERTLEDGSDGAHDVGRILADKRIGSDDARLEMATEAMARAGVLQQVAIYSAAGELLDAIGPKPKPPEKLPPVAIERSRRATQEQAAAQGEGKPSMPVGAWLPIEHEPGIAWMRYAEPIVTADKGETTGWVLATLKPELLDEQLRQLSRDRFEGHVDGVVLIDEQTRVLAGGDAGELGLGQPIGNRDIFAAHALPAGALEKPFASATEFVDSKGQPMFGTVRSLPSRKWAVIVRRPTASVFLALKRATQSLVAAAALFFALAIVLGAWLAGRTIRPVRQLVELSRAYGRRKFGERSPVVSGDELQELGSSMTDMADALAAGEVELNRRTRVEADLSRYMPSEVAKAIAAGERSIDLGGQRQSITVVFADVVSFTSFAEKAPPERVVAMLNELFTVLTEVVFRHGGTVDKFIGDCVMAVFGARVGADMNAAPETDHASRALAAAEDMHRFVEVSSDLWREKYGVAVQLGIGVATGEAIVGNLGSEQRMEFTAIGDVVNVAARLEAMARPGQTLVTGAVAASVGGAGRDDDGAFSFNALGDHPLRGKSTAIAVLELS